MKTEKKSGRAAGGMPTKTFLLLFAGFAVLPQVLQALGISLNLGTEMLIIALFAMGYNLMLGTTGLPAFGHAALFGTGAYAVGVMGGHGMGGFVEGLVGATVAGMLAAFLIGVLVMKKRGIYFGLLTLAFGQMFYIIALRWDEVTGGETGLTGIERPMLFFLDMNNPTVFYWTVLVIFSASVALLWKITNSPFGSLLTAIKSNEIRTRYLGYETVYYKLLAFTISGAFSGLAGGLFAWHQYAVYPQTLFWVESGNIVIMTLLGGGLTSFLGPVLGAAVFVGAQDLISSYTEHWMFFFGLLFILIVTAFPNGLPEAFSRLYRAVRRKAGGQGSAPSQDAVKAGD
ncbi:branched-chain amino acid ABC transporter permease [Castellaniella sp.]|uniref:branched-chain amino acid ABC transporter permease n=1 Tax=Castellaniella sp. TaxID=1955812 RepID=UPI003C7295D4